MTQKICLNSFVFYTKMLLLKVEDTSALLKSLKEEQEAASLKAKTAADERHIFFKKKNKCGKLLHATQFQIRPR